MRCMECGADYHIESLADSMNDGFEDALSDIRCDRF